MQWSASALFCNCELTLTRSTAINALYRRHRHVRVSGWLRLQRVLPWGLLIRGPFDGKEIEFGDSRC